MPRAPALRLPARLAVLREREFRLLYAGQTVSPLGDGMLVVALSFAVLNLTASVSDLGFAFAVSRIPLVLTVLAGGVGLGAGNGIWETTLPLGSRRRRCRQSRPMTGSVRSSSTRAALRSPVIAAACWFVVSSLSLAAPPSVRSVRDG